MNALCLWLSNRRLLSNIHDDKLVIHRSEIIRIFGTISSFLRKSSPLTIETIYKTAMTTANYHHMVSISSFKILLTTVLRRPDNLTLSQHQKLHNILNNTKRENIQIKNNYIHSYNIFRINNHTLCDIFKYLQYDEQWPLKHVCVTWTIAMCSLSQYKLHNCNINYTNHLCTNSLDEIIFERLQQIKNQIEVMLAHNHLKQYYILYGKLKSNDLSVIKSKVVTLQIFEIIFKEIIVKKKEYLFGME
eukprot:4130_1